MYEVFHFLCISTVLSSSGAVTENDFSSPVVILYFSVRVSNSVLHSGADLLF